MAEQTPSFAEVLRRAVRAGLVDVHTSIPGVIVSYDDATRRADVQPVIRKGKRDASGQRVATRIPVVTNVPVIFPGSGGRRVKFPVSVGDEVWLSFCEASLDQWLAKGGSDVDPGDDRRFNLSDAVAHVGLDREGIDADVAIEFTADGKILAGGGEALATKADLDDLKATIASWTPTANDGGAALKTKLTALFDTWPAGTSVLKGS